MREAAVTARGVRERNDRCGMQISVRRQELGTDIELGIDSVLGNGGEAHTHEAREPAIAAGRERVQCRFGSQRHCSRAATHERTDCSAAGNAAGLVPPA